MDASDFKVVGADPYIVTIDNNLDPSFCEEMIRRFEIDPHTHQGVTSGGVNLEVKQSYDLNITSDPERWSDIDEGLFAALAKGLAMYSDHLYPQEMMNIPGGENQLKDTGYQIQKTVPGGFYHWHHDFMWYEDRVCGENSDKSSIRSITFLWYLNDVQDGYTEFKNGSRVYPEQGKLLLFPATWTYVHRGTPPKSDKYICTGWFYSELQDKPDEEERSAPIIVGPLRGELPQTSTTGT